MAFFVNPGKDWENNLTEEDIYDHGDTIDFPLSVVNFFDGKLGIPYGGFPEDLQKVVLKGREPITCRPGELLEDDDYEEFKRHIVEDLGLEGTDQQQLSYAMYSKVFDDYVKDLKKKGNFRNMGSDVYFHGIALGQTAEITLTEGKTMVIPLEDVSAPNAEGMRDLTFTINGNRRVISVKDKQALTTSVMAGSAIQFASEDDPDEIGANIPGNIIKVLVKEGEKVEANQPIAVIEAMKMETNILAAAAGTVERIYVSEGQQVKAGEMVAKLK